MKSQATDVIALHQQDEMAIPTYLHGNPLIRWLFWKRYQLIFQMLAARIFAPTSVLEFGCGIGVFLPNLCLLADQVYATDLFPQVAQGLAKRYHLEVTFVEGLAEFPQNNLDAIIAADVMEHLEAPEKYASLFWEKLKPGGWLIVSGPTENWLYQIGRWVAGFQDKGDYHHTNILRLSQLIQATSFRLGEKHQLPLPGPLCLFQVLAFEKQGRRADYQAGDDPQDG